jgi:hypothetical protein
MVRSSEKGMVREFSRMSAREVRLVGLRRATFLASAIPQNAYRWFARASRLGRQEVQP